MPEIDCVFCRIIAREIPSLSIYESEKALAFLDIGPRVTGHVMVIPKVHVPVLADLPEAEIGPLFSAVKKVALKIREVLAPDGITIGMNQGEASGQVVPHLHIHLLPRWQNDGGGSVQSIVNKPPQEELPAIQEKLKIN